MLTVGFLLIILIKNLLHNILYYFNSIDLFSLSLFFFFISADVVKCIYDSDCPVDFCPAFLNISCVGMRCKCTS